MLRRWRTIGKVAMLGGPLLCLATATLVAGETPPVLTLEAAIALSEAQHPRLTLAGARVAAASASLDSARAAGRPRLDLRAGFLRTDNPVAVFGNLLLQERFGQENFALDRLNQPSPLSDWQLGVDLEHALWTAGRRSTISRPSVTGMPPQQPRPSAGATRWYAK